MLLHSRGRCCAATSAAASAAVAAAAASRGASTTAATSGRGTDRSVGRCCSRSTAGAREPRRGAHVQGGAFGSLLRGHGLRRPGAYAAPWYAAQAPCLMSVPWTWRMGMGHGYIKVLLVVSVPLEMSYDTYHFTSPVMVHRPAESSSRVVTSPTTQITAGSAGCAARRGEILGRILLLGLEVAAEFRLSCVRRLL